jgi:hypothetical protein
MALSWIDCRAMRAALVGLLLVPATLRPPVVHSAEPAFVVVAAAGATERHLSREAVARLFMRRQLYWDGGLRAQPVNLPARHPLRRLFSQNLLGSRPEDLDDYWRDMYFHGVLPPHVLGSEEAVLLFVASTPGAIGYVSGCAGTARLQIVLIVGDAPDCPR